MKLHYRSGNGGSTGYSLCGTETTATPIELVRAWSLNCRTGCKNCLKHVTFCAGCRVPTVKDRNSVTGNSYCTACKPKS